MSTMPKNDTSPVEDRGFALYWVTHSNRPGLSSVLLRALASMQPALDGYLSSILYRVSDVRFELRASDV
jgi:hypothetical protein